MAKILVVDDSEVQRIEMRDALEAGGHKVIEAGDGTEGLEKLAANADIDLIITDLNMPKMDGLTMCKAIQALALAKPIPIFMLTTESAAELKTSGKAAGVVLWAIKPFAVDKILMAIDKVLKKAA